MKFCLVFILLSANFLYAVTVPAGTQLTLRLTTEVTSEKPSGQPLDAVVIVPVLVNATPAIATGTRLTGKTTDVKAATLANGNTPASPAALRINLDKIESTSGKSEPIHCVLVSVDNARESVDSSGLITGINQADTITERIDQGINKLSNKYGQFAQILSGVKGAIVKEADPAIDYKPGVEFTVKLTQPLDWNSPAPANSVGPITPADALIKLVNQEPFRTVAQKPPNPSDLINLMFIGSLEQVKSAFKAAGWVAAAELTQQSTMETARAIMENRGYSEAPMSILYLEGKPPDLALQKQNNTFAMRHHIRIWQRPQEFQGKPVWLAAATHDIKYTFSRESKTITHGIDPHIDLERAKVVDDLLFTGQVRARSLVDRKGIPPNLSNATGDPLITDGKLAVLEFE